MKQVWLISYSHPGGFGRFVNTRADEKRPSFADIEDMEKKICEQHGLSMVCVLHVSRLQDEE
ncbi:hypothetical protein AH01_16 [Pantoea phage AH01]|nr:hypothetical protein AH01_16 [Pantoea phage AH01]